MTLFGLDLNASRARAVAGAPGDHALPVALEPPHAEMPLALYQDSGRPQVGTAALRQCRRTPHLVRSGLLPTLAATPDGPTASDMALSLALRELAEVCKRLGGGVIAVPAYLEAGQLERLFFLAECAGLPLLGGLASPLALALAAHAEQGWAGAALVIEVDEHALTVAHVAAVEGQAHLAEVRSVPRLGLRTWRGRLLNAIADRCILQSRRDPRECPEAEQSLFDQLASVWESCGHGRAVTVGLQAGSWYQNVVLQPEDVCAAVALLVRLTVEQVAEAFATTQAEATPGALFLSATAGRLPGLLAALHARFGLDGPKKDQRTVPGATEDFGEGLLEIEEAALPLTLQVLGPDAVGRAAHRLAADFVRGDLPRGYLQVSAPLPLPQSAEAGPARLQYQGEEYLVDRDPFTLGRQSSCDLVFDASAYPAVAPRHCEIIHAGQGYTVWDRSRSGTLINERPVQQSAALQPGDSLRLGPDGPLLRFLGQA